jgi:SPP1 family predicted phage head-tail adaptor
VYWRDTVTLEAVTHGADSEGFPQEAVTQTEVYADVQSVRRSEFYAARQIGVDLAISVKLRAADYNGQERLVWNCTRYKVERSYTEAREMYELECSEFREVTP